MMMRSLNALCLLLMVAVYAAPLHAQQQQQRDTAGLAVEMAVMYKLYADKQYALDIRYTFAASSKPDLVLDSVTGRLEVADKNFRYELGNTASVSNGRYNIILQSAMKKMHVSKHKAGDQPMKMIQAGFLPVAVKSWSVSQKGSLRVFHADFLTGFPFVSLDVTKDMSTGYLTTLRYLIPADQLKRFGIDKEETKEDFGDYAVVLVTYTQDKRYKPDMTVFDEQSYFRKTETTLVPSPAFSGYQVFKASPDL
ncbi:hypothetical protein HHL17_14435 [Chitinophaga sp. G-6-1-13]|uniref:DUF3108 domain-containing protein n=1 Tax=Chitinophaga fulva TaxID=2728842 RepID=A0A848GN79_9BACT|nr:hypothetical protein [Chitinophaga fulva]NML38402.1 hypothetical protein [Chitinophaga fulva]